jgi:hypothetical protein
LQIRRLAIGDLLQIADWRLVILFGNLPGTVEGSDGARTNRQSPNKIFNPTTLKSPINLHSTIDESPMLIHSPRSRKDAPPS